MTRRIAILAAAAALAASALPAAAADLDGYGADRPGVPYGRGDLGPEGYGFRGDVERERLIPRRGPGPVVFDERRGFEDRDGFIAERGPDLPPPPRIYGHPDGVGPGLRGFAAGYGGLRPAPFYRPAAAPVGPTFGEPEGGCTIERARSITPAGWQKTVTRRICYRR